MELPEPIEEINEQLKRHFGIDTEGHGAMFRVVWAADQFEHRLQSHTPEGMQLIHPEVRLVPKYKKADHDCYVLERLVIVPTFHERDIPSSAKSYEPVHHFFNNIKGKRTVLPPKFYICKFIIDTLLASMGKGPSMAKYIDEEAVNPEETRERRLNEIMEYLYDDESFLLGRTVTGEAVAYTGEPKIKPVSEEK